MSKRDPNAGIRIVLLVIILGIIGFYVGTTNPAVANWFRQYLTVILSVVSLIAGISAAIFILNNPDGGIRKYFAMALLIISGLYLFYLYVVPPLLVWIIQNILAVIVALICLSIATAVVLKRRRRRAEAGGRNNGSPTIFKFSWKPPDMDNPDAYSKLALAVYNSIEEFRPSNSYDKEKPYHDELFSHLKKEFPQAEMEPMIQGGRPDIEIERIAVEVKGPTRNRDLDTLTSKVLIYGSKYTFVFCILFKPEFSESRFQVLKEALQQRLPHCGVITKKD
jgi:hypothetical protein